MSTQDNKLLTVSEALSFLGISRATFDRWKKDKQLPFIKIGKEVFVNKEKLDLWLRQFDHSSPRVTTEPSTTIPIHIGYQTGSAQLWSSILIKKMNIFTKQLVQDIPDIQFQVHWHRADNGIELVQQFLSGHLNMVAVGDFPIHISFSLAKLFPSFKPLLIAFDGKTKNNDGIALMLQNHVNDVLEIANVHSTSSAYHLRQFMKKQNQPYISVTKGSMDLCMDSFLQQEVDGAMLWEPYLTIVEQLGAGERKVIEDDSVYLTGIVANQHLLKDHIQHRITVSFIKSLIKAHQLLNVEDEQAITTIEEETSISPHIIREVIKRIRFDAAVYHDDIKRINQMYTESTLNQLLVEAEMTTQAKIHFDSIYLTQAIEQLQLPKLSRHSLAGAWLTQCY